MLKMSSPPEKTAKFDIQGLGVVSRCTKWRYVKEKTEQLLAEAEAEVKASTSDLTVHPPGVDEDEQIYEFCDNYEYYSPDELSDDDFENYNEEDQADDISPSVNISPPVDILPSVNVLPSEDVLAEPLEGIEKTKTILSNWFLNFQIPKAAANALLKDLPNIDPTTLSQLPKDIRTLLPKIKSLQVNEKCGGQYAYFGIQAELNSLNRSFFNDITKIELSINIDGLPLYKSSGNEFWPILGSIGAHDVFIIALLYCQKKPADFNEFLYDFVEEATKLSTDGVKIGNQIYEFRIKNVIADMPAKSAILKIKGHTGYSSCSKCVVKGENVNGYICFASTDSEKRSDEEFRQKTDTDHHWAGELSLLCRIPGFNLIEDVILDYMHLVCLGVMKRLLTAWIEGFSNSGKVLSAAQVLKISEKIGKLYAYNPAEFQRHPRSLTHIAKWKATEFRQFLLYYGPAVLHGELPPAHYELFTTLQIAIRILCGPESSNSDNIDFAEILLKSFIKKSSKLFGPEFVSANVHALQHLPDDVRKFGALDTFSAFKFENFLGKVKSLIRSGNNPLQQAINRYYELKLLTESSGHRPYYAEPLLVKPIKQTTNDENIKTTYYRGVKLRSFTLRVDNMRDNFFVTTDSKYYKLEEIMQSSNGSEILIKGKEFLLIHSLYEEPASSLAVDVMLLGNLATKSTNLTIEKIEGKCYAVPFEIGVYSYSLIKLLW